MTSEQVVYVIIPVHNRSHFTKACLDSLRLQTYPQLVPVVIDDGSTDGTAEQLREFYPEVVLLRGDGELWWAGATNLGVGLVLQRCAANDFVLLLNNDTAVEPSYVATLVRVCGQHDRRALVGSVSVDIRDRATIADGGPHVNWRTAKWGSSNVGRRLEDVRAEGVTSVDASVLPGRGTLVPVECFADVGLFESERLPQYAADYEFSARAKRAGYRLVMTYEAPVLSEVEATGPSSARGRLPWGVFFGTYFSRRAPACLLYRWRYGWLAAPRGSRLAYIVADTVRVVAGGLRDQFSGGRL